MCSVIPCSLLSLVANSLFHANFVLFERGFAEQYASCSFNCLVHKKLSTHSVSKFYLLSVERLLLENENLLASLVVRNP